MIKLLLVLIFILLTGCISESENNHGHNKINYADIEQCKFNYCVDNNLDCTEPMMYCDSEVHRLEHELDG